MNWTPTLVIKAESYAAAHGLRFSGGVDGDTVKFAKWGNPETAPTQEQLEAWDPEQQVPESVAKEKFVLQLAEEGMLTAASTFISSSAIPEGPQRDKAKAAWFWGQTVPRNGPVVIALLTHLGKDSAAIDEFFRNAAAQTAV